MGMPPGAEGPDQEEENDMTKDADETPDAEQMIQEEMKKN